MSNFDEATDAGALVAQVDRLMAEVERLHEANRWIFCKDQMPERGDFYLATLTCNANKIVRSVYWLGASRRWDIKDDYAIWDIICWRPLPEPPEDDKCEGGVK